jgi:hypothetical protein
LVPRALGPGRAAEKELRTGDGTPGLAAAYAARYATPASPELRFWAELLSLLVVGNTLAIPELHQSWKQCIVQAVVSAYLALAAIRLAIKAAEQNRPSPTTPGRNEAEWHPGQDGDGSPERRREPVDLARTASPVDSLGAGSDVKNSKLAGKPNK